MKLPDSDKSTDELVADLHEATDDLQGAMGTDLQEAVVQRIADAIGLLTLRGSASQLQDMGIQTDVSYGLLLPASDPDAMKLDDAVANRDVETLRALLAERADIPEAVVDGIIESLLRSEGDRPA